MRPSAYFGPVPEARAQAKLASATTLLGDGRLLASDTAAPDGRVADRKAPDVPGLIQYNAPDVTKGAVGLDSVLEMLVGELTGSVAVSEALFTVLAIESVQ